MPEYRGLSRVPDPDFSSNHLHHAGNIGTSQEREGETPGREGEERRWGGGGEEEGGGVKIGFGEQKV